MDVGGLGSRGILSMKKPMMLRILLMAAQGWRGEIMSILGNLPTPCEPEHGHLAGAPKLAFSLLNLSPRP